MAFGAGDWVADTFVRERRGRVRHCFRAAGIAAVAEGLLGGESRGRLAVSRSQRAAL
jgi:hypothetical protein